MKDKPKEKPQPNPKAPPQDPDLFDDDTREQPVMPDVIQPQYPD